MEITDTFLTNEIIHEAMKIFTQWATKHEMAPKDVGPNQKLTNWRPYPAIALITTQNDLFELAKSIPHVLPKRNFETLFRSDTVLRLKII